jgi:antitoxin YefM
MTTTTIRKLRANLKSYFDRIDDNKEILVVPRKGEREAIVMMTLSEYNSMVETDYLLSTKANRKALEDSIKELDSNDVVEFNLES